MKTLVPVKGVVEAATCLIPDFDCAVLSFAWRDWYWTNYAWERPNDRSDPLCGPKRLPQNALSEPPERLEKPAFTPDLIHIKKQPLFSIYLSPINIALAM